jgi:hypothetical protein
MADENLKVSGISIVVQDTEFTEFDTILKLSHFRPECDVAWSMVVFGASTRDEFHPCSLSVLYKLEERERRKKPKTK